VLDGSDDANSCRAIAVGSQAQEYQIGCRDSENQGTILVTAPFSISDKAARVRRQVFDCARNLRAQRSMSRGH
jgi:hypothetical protein